MENVEACTETTVNYNSVKDILVLIQDALDESLNQASSNDF